MNRIITVLLAIAFLVTINFQTSAQINIQSGVDPNAMVENIVGDGVVYDNVQYTGANSARGIFTNGSTTNLGIESGVFLTSGAGYVIPGPNGPGSCSAGANNGTAGDATLTALAGVSTYDAAVLQFDFIPESDTLRFKYVFGSEEYNEWVFSTFNDVFGFFVSGPDPNGGYYSSKNVALIPGTTIPIAINNVNNGYSSCDVIPTGPCTYCEYYIDNTGGMTLEYDGFTAVLTAWIMVVPCETYHIKMAVADAGDGIYDTGIFLEENSFESPKIDVEAEPTPEGVSDNMVEGCVEADIIFRLPNSSYAPITINYEITGTADPDLDFEDPIPTSVTIDEGNDSAFIHVAPIQDGLLEGDETLIFIITNELGCQVRYDTVEFIIVDYVDMILDVTPDMAICEGQSVELTAQAFNGISPYTYQWVEPSIENDTIEVTPEETTTYVVQVTDMCEGFIEDSVQVVVLEMPELELGNDTVVCGADSLVLHAGGGFASYQWQDGSTDSIYVVTQPGTYWVQVMAANGCVAGDQITVNFFPPIFVDLGNDTVICQGETVILDAGAGFESYYWQDGSTQQTYEVTETGTYWVQVFDANGCTTFDTIQVSVDNDAPQFTLGDDLTLCYGTTYTLSTGLPAGYLYEWQDGSTDSVYIVSQPGLYSVTVTGGCGEGYDTIMINYYPPVNVNLGPDTTMCQGESITLDGGNGFLSYTWQDGSSSQYYNVYESGIYSVQVTDAYGCNGADTITVEVAKNVELIPDSSFCEGETVVLDAGFGFDSYEWSTGSTSQIIHATEGGTYWVNASYVFGCPSSDTTVLTMFPLANADLGGDKDLCEGDTVILTAPEGEFEYFWNDQPGESTYTVTQGGTYKLTMKNYCGEDSDEIEITEYPLPYVTLGDDQTLLPGESVQLDPGEFLSYLWMDGTTDRYYTVSYDTYTDSVYTVEVWDAHCKNSASVIIEIFNVEVPNVITPNGDNKNDIFRPKDDGWNGIKQNKIIVYNRWGGKVWESSDFQSGWDGKVNGKTVASGTYFWVLEVTYGTNNAKKTFKGSLTVLGTD